MSEKNNISAPEEEIDVNEFRQIRIDKLKAMQEAATRSRLQRQIRLMKA